MTVIGLQRSESRIRPTSSHIVGDIAEEEPVPEAYKDAVLRDESTLKAGWLAKKGKRGGVSAMSLLKKTEFAQRF